MKKLNNKGFNMVEIMVAIVVLLILTVPLVNYFIASFKTNASAKRRQYATNLAQETVEEIQGINLEDVLQYYVFDASQNKYTRDDSKEIPQKYKEFTQTYQYIRRTAGNETTGYCYTLFPEKIDKKGKYEFQRSITVDARDYSSGSTLKNPSDTSKKPINEQTQTVNIKSLDPEKTAVIGDKMDNNIGNTDFDAQRDIYTKKKTNSSLFTNPPFDYGDFMKREIVVEYGKDLSTGKYHVKCYATYTQTQNTATDIETVNKDIYLDREFTEKPEVFVFWDQFHVYNMKKYVETGDKTAVQYPSDAINADVLKLKNTSGEDYNLYLINGNGIMGVHKNQSRIDDGTVGINKVNIFSNDPSVFTPGFLPIKDMDNTAMATNSEFKSLYKVKVTITDKDDSKFSVTLNSSKGE